MQRQAIDKTARAWIGFGVGARGEVLGYARVTFGGKDRLVRLAPVERARPGISARDAAYAAVTAAAAALRRRGACAVELVVDDDELVRDIHERREVPAPLELPYVRLRCELNRFAQASLVGADAETRDLSARARAELMLRVAA